MSETLTDRLRNLSWTVRRRVPIRSRTALRLLWERTLNDAPDGPFLAARRRYADRMNSAGYMPPPALLRAAAFRKGVPTSIQAFELLGRPGVRLTNIDSIMTRVIFWAGDRWVLQKGAGLDVWAALCARAEYIVEVGANVGYYTIVGGQLAREKYVAYEPHPRSCAALRANLQLNGIDRAQAVEAAVVAEPKLSRVELVCPIGADRGAPTGAMVKGSSLEDVEPGRETELLLVDTVPFADAIGGSDLVKIDVEGSEASLLASATTQLRASKPAIMVEIHDRNHDLRALVPDLIHDLDASVYAMHHDHLAPVEPGVMENGPLFSTSHTWDYLIVPAARASLVKGLVRTDSS